MQNLPIGRSDKIDLRGHGDDLGVRHHRGVTACNVVVALIKLPVPASGGLRLVAAVHLGDVVALDVAHRAHRQEARKRHGEVVAQTQQLATLVSQVVDKLRVLPVLAGQQLLQLEHGRVDLHTAVALEHAADCGERLFADAHLLGSEVARTLRNLGLELATGVELLQDFRAVSGEAALAAVEWVQQRTHAGRGGLKFLHELAHKGGAGAEGHRRAAAGLLLLLGCCLGRRLFGLLLALGLRAGPLLRCEVAVVRRLGLALAAVALCVSARRGFVLLRQLQLGHVRSSFRGFDGTENIVGGQYLCAQSLSEALQQLLYAQHTVSGTDGGGDGQWRGLSLSYSSYGCGPLRGRAHQNLDRVAQVLREQLHLRGINCLSFAEAVQFDLNSSIVCNAQ